MTMAILYIDIVLVLTISCITGILTTNSECPQLAYEDSYKTFTVAAVQMEPYLRQGDGCYTGLIPDMLSKMSYTSGDNFEIKISPENIIGTMRSNGTFSGLIGNVTRREADIAAGPIGITSMRMKAVDFTFPFMQSEIVILFKRPTPLETVPFSDVGTLLSSGVSIGSVLDGTVGDYLKFMEMHEARRLYAAITSQGNWYDSFQVALRRVWKGNFALIIEKDRALYAAKEKPCNVVIVGKPLAYIDYAFALPKRMWRKFGIDLAVHELRAKGEMRKLKEKYWESNCDCNSECDCKNVCGSPIYSKGNA